MATNDGKTRVPVKHETVMDVTEEQLARVYAQAFWGVAQKQPDLAAKVDEVGAVVTEVLDKYPALEEMLGSALIAHDEKVRLLDRLFAKRLSPTVLNLLKVMSAHGRLGILRAVVRQIDKLHIKHRGQMEVEVRVAAELNDQLRAEILGRLREHMKHEPLMRVVVDPEVVGGIMIQIGDRVYDGSLRTRFEMARKSIIARAVELIETKPEMFVGAAD